MATNGNGAAAPASGNGTQTTAEAQEDIDHATDSILKKYGVAPKSTPPPETETPPVKPKEKKSEGAEESEEQKVEREAAAAGDGEQETEEEKVEREAAEAAAAGDGETDEEKAAEAEKAETAKLVTTKLKDLPEELQGRVQTVIDERLGKVIAKERAARDEAETKAVAAETRITELEGELAEAKKGGGATVNVPGVHPLFLAKSAAEIDARLDTIESFLEWAEDHPEGYEAPEGSADTGWTAEQVRARARELRREKDRVIPQARQLLADRATKDSALQKTYSALFKSGTEEYRAAQDLRKLMPELSRHPDANTLIARLILGEKALAALAKTPGGKAATTTTPPKRAPRAPGGGGSAKGVATNTGATNSVPDAVKRVMANPGDSNARRLAFEAIATET